MKKRILGIVLILLSLLMSCVPVIADAETNLKYDNCLYYEVNGDNTEVTITDCDTSATEIVIPSEIGGLPVTRIAVNAFSACNSLVSVIIPDSVYSISNYAFSNCSVEDINIGSSVSYIGNIVFQNCNNLSNITVNENNRDYYSIDGNLFDKHNHSLIQYAIGKKDLVYTIPDGTTKIEGLAFENCNNLKSVIIPNSVTAIDVYAFCSFSSLESITIPNSISTIGNFAFADCDNLKNINLNGITNIGIEVFRGCYNLISITIPASVTSIGEYAFDECSSLTDVYYLGSKADWTDIYIDEGNECLTNAAIHYNSIIPTPMPTTTAIITKTDTAEDKVYKFEIDAENKYENCYVCAAIYDNNNIFLSFNRVPLETTEATTILVNKTANDSLAKVFIWADTLQPITETAKEFTLK